MAAQLNHASVCKLLVEHGCNINHRDGQNRLDLNYWLIIWFHSFAHKLLFGFTNESKALTNFSLDAELLWWWLLSLEIKKSVKSLFGVAPIHFLLMIMVLHLFFVPFIVLSIKPLLTFKILFVVRRIKELPSIICVVLACHIICIVRCRKKMKYDSHEFYPKWPIDLHSVSWTNGLLLYTKHSVLIQLIAETKNYHLLLWLANKSPALHV